MKQESYLKNALQFATAPASVAWGCVRIGGGAIAATDLTSTYRAVVPTDGIVPEENAGLFHKQQIKALLAGASVRPAFAFDDMPLDDRIPEQTNEYARCDSQRLAKQLDRLAVYASRDTLRPNINGVCLETHTGLLVATDGHRLLAERLDGSHQPAEEERPAIIPLTAIQRLAKCLKPHRGECVISLAAKSIRFDFGAETIATILVEGGYPNWRMALPEPNTTETYDRAELLAAAKRLSLVYGTEKGYRTLRFALGVASAKSVYEQAKDSVELAAEATGHPKPWLVNAPYLIAALRDIPDGRVTIAYLSPVEQDEPIVLSTIFVRGESEPAVHIRGIQPMRKD